ncbi:hypothetical protein [Halocola ammonii]
MKKNFKEILERINEAADWDNTKLRQKDKATISCHPDESYEMEPLKKEIRNTHPGHFTKAEVDAAIEHCCKKKGQSRNRDEFYECVYNRLFEKL